MTAFSQIIQYIISGITSGSIYAMVGVCWSIVFLVTGILNFATGQFVMLGGMVSWLLIESGMGLAPAIFISIASVIVIGSVMERLVIRPVRYPSETTFMVITIAAASIIKGLVLITCGSETRAIPSMVPEAQVPIFGAVITSQIFVVIGVLIIMTVCLSIFFGPIYKSKATVTVSVTGRG
jgi:branched-chain amino acid transport system permease protein